MSSTFRPDTPPRDFTDEQQHWLRRVQNKIKDAWEAAKPYETLQVLHVAPTKTLAGMIVQADGSDWNPGSGEGVYYRNKANAAWVFLGSTGGTGAGDIVGPGSATANAVALFNGTTGKLIKDSGLSLSGSNTGDQTISITGDVTAAGSAGALAATVTKVNGVSFAGLLTGILKNTTATGVPSIAVVGTDYLAPSSVAATVAAGTAAQGQGPLTSDINVITTTGTVPGGVTLPTATVGRRVTVINKGTGLVGLYPASGASIDAAGLNLPLSLAVGGILEFVASSTTQWYSSQNTSYLLPWGLAHIKQAAVATAAAATTITGAQITQGIFQYTGAAAAATWPTGTAIDAALQSGFPVDMGFDYYVVNTGSGTATMTTNTGLTLVGAMTVALSTSGHFRLRKTAANTFTIYRLS